jgi:hypothetical protein
MRFSISPSTISGSPLLPHHARRVHNHITLWVPKTAAPCKGGPFPVLHVTARPKLVVARNRNSPTVDQRPNMLLCFKSADSFMPGTPFRRTYLGFLCVGPIHLSHFSCLNSDGVISQALVARPQHILASLKRRRSIWLLQLLHAVYPGTAAQIRAHKFANLVSSYVDGVLKSRGSTF